MLSSVRVILLLVVLTANAAAVPPPGPPARDLEEEAERGRAEPVFDRIWGLATIYENPENPVLEKFAIRGRFQVDFPVFESDQGSYHEPQVRRFRIGVKTHWLSDIVIHVEADYDLSCEQGEVCDDDARQGLTDAYIGWSPSKAFQLKGGKLSAPFTLDGATSSNNLISLERNNVANNLWFPAEYHVGVNASGQVDAWRYQAGVYSSSTTEAFGSLDGGVFMLLTLAHDFSERLGVSECELVLDYVYNEADPDNVSTRDLAHVVSLHFRYDDGLWGLRSELSGGIGYGTQPDLIGLAVMPFVHLTRHFELVGRYTYLNSFGENGIRFGRYESQIETGRGDLYNEFFLGLNWFIYGHKFKLQTGIKYTMMDDQADDGGEYRGWGWTLGFRMSW